MMDNNRCKFIGVCHPSNLRLNSIAFKHTHTHIFCDITWYAKDFKTWA